VDKGRLVDVAKGKVVWSTEMRKFVSPDPARAERQMLATVNFWSRTAIKKIEEKKASLLTPLEHDENELVTAVDNAFARLHIANATITAHLNSLRKVREVQDEALAALDLKELQDKINEMLISMSEKAMKGLKAIEKADGLLDQF
jgi:predicted nuclease with TOPRIM domain